jgi:flagellar motor switch/type III secretory pathway protein FliN
MAVQPFPWRSLETLPAANIAALHDVRRWAQRSVRLDAFSAALAEIVGAPLTVRVRRATPRAAGGALDGGVALVLAREGAGPAALDTACAALVAVDGALAALVVSRVLRRPTPRVSGPLARDAAGPTAGALAAIVMAAARRAHADRESDLPVVVAAGAAVDLETRFVQPERHWLAIALTILVGDEAFDARVVVAREVAEWLPDTAWTRCDLAALGATPLAMPIVACTAAMTVDELADLRGGDALLLGPAWRLALRSQGGDTRLVGDVVLAAPGATHGVRARLVEDGRLVLSGEAGGVDDGEGNAAGDLESMDAVEKAQKTVAGKQAGSEPAGEALLDAVGDIPVVVRVEIGEAQMAAREWAGLAAGDVIALGRRVGELVVLRVGGVAVARGELVNVDGEVGVRIAERLGERTSEALTER